MRTDGLTVAVIGGGIAGMAAAAALAQRGACVTVYEQAEGLREQGAGIQISANGQKVLAHLGAAPENASGQAVVSTGTRFCSGWTGRPFATLSAPASGPTWYMHRADLLEQLAEVAQNAGAKFEFGARRTLPDLTADLIIAADGMRSDLRKFVSPDTPPPKFQKSVAWRALVPGQFAARGPGALYLGPGKHVVTYPVRGGSLLNIVGIEDRSDWTEENWNLIGDIAEFQRRFSVFKGPAGEAIRAAAQVHQWALHLRPVARSWHRDNVALIGDAAHATLPFMAQGACLALEDVAVLARALDQTPDIDVALQMYQAARKSRAERIVRLAAGNSWRFHMPRPFAWGAQAALRIGAPVLARQLEWVYAYDATEVEIA